MTAILTTSSGMILVFHVFMGLSTFFRRSNRRGMRCQERRGVSSFHICFSWTKAQHSKLQLSDLGRRREETSVFLFYSSFPEAVGEVGISINTTTRSHESPVWRMDHGKSRHAHHRKTKIFMTPSRGKSATLGSWASCSLSLSRSMKTKR